MRGERLGRALKDGTTDEHPPPPARSPFALSLDLRDVMGFGGAMLVLGVAASHSWAAAAGVLGLALVAAALRLSK